MIYCNEMGFYDVWDLLLPPIAFKCWEMETMSEKADILDRGDGTFGLEPCSYCGNQIKIHPIVDEHQGRISVRCPYCLSNRGVWVSTLDEAISAWNIEQKKRR